MAALPCRDGVGAEPDWRAVVMVTILMCGAGRGGDWGIGMKFVVLILVKAVPDEGPRDAS